MGLNLLTVGAVLARRGLLNPGPPHRQVAQLLALQKWGFGLAGELRQAAHRVPQRVAVLDEDRGPAHRQRPTHLLQLSAGRHLLGEQSRLAAVEQPLEPADQLRLGDPQLGVARRRVLTEGKRDPLQLADQHEDTRR